MLGDPDSGVRAGSAKADVAAASLAACVVVAARLCLPVPLPVVAGVALAGFAVRRAWVLALALVLATSMLGAWAQEGLVAPERGPVEGEVMLVTDPERAFGGVRVEVREASGRRCQAVGRGASGAALSELLAGETASISGAIEPLQRPHLEVRHIACRIQVSEVDSTSPGSVPHRIANALRRTLVDGAQVLPGELRGLYSGFLLGDARGQSPEVADDFLASGLTHLLVVSGQNVAFVLLCASPLLVRLRPWPRFVAVGTLLAFFALLTRFEPSVLRATAMAGLAAFVFARGRRSSGIRLLAGAVILLLLVDPFLARSVGFGLSVGASAGILLLARPLADAVPGPRWLAGPLGVVGAAQVGVAPLLIPVFGGIQVASGPANLLAGPLSGFVMVWGLTVGFVAGVVTSTAGWAGEAVASVLMLPARLSLQWMAGVAERAASLGLGELGPHLALLIAAACGGAVLARRLGLRAASATCALVALLLLATPWATADPPGPGRHRIPGLGELTVAAGPDGRDQRVLALDPRTSPARILESARKNQIAHLDLVLTASGGPAAASRIRALRHRVDVEEVWAPEGHGIDGAVTPRPGRLIQDALTLQVVESEPRLDVEVEVLPEDGAARRDAQGSGARGGAAAAGLP